MSGSSKLEISTIKHIKTSLKLIWKLLHCFWFVFKAFNGFYFTFQWNERNFNRLAYINNTFLTEVAQTCLKSIKIKSNFHGEIFMLLFFFLINEIYHELPFIPLYADSLNLSVFSCLGGENKNENTEIWKMEIIKGGSREKGESHWIAWVGKVYKNVTFIVARQRYFP